MTKTPNLFIPAFPKAGTSAIATMLCQHPQVAMPNVEGLPWRCFEKEPRWFWCDDADSGPRLDHVDECYGDEQYRLDATSTYMLEGLLPTIMQASPKARFIITMREPATRAISRWNHFQQLYAEGGNDAVMYWGMDPRRTMEEQLNAELMGEPGELVAPGKYAAHLRKLVKLVPRERLHIVFMEHLRANPQWVMQRMFTFLGLEPVTVVVKEVNTREHTVQVTHETLHNLRDIYSTANGELETMVDRMPECYKYWLDEKCC